MAARIPIVDAPPSSGASARALLEADGYEVVGEAVDGHSAVEAALALLPDVVLLDVQLPDIDGFEVAARLRDHGYGVAVVLTSSREASDYRPLPQRSGARRFVPKAELSARATAAVLAPGPSPRSS